MAKNEAQSPSGLLEIFKILATLVLSGVLLVLIFMLAHFVANKGNWNVKSPVVIASISVNSANCPKERPVEIGLKNNGREDVLRVNFKIMVSDQGHSTLYGGRTILSNDRIIAPGNTHRSCYELPDELLLDLSSPQYEVRLVDIWPHDGE